jgi:transposase
MSKPCPVVAGTVEPRPPRLRCVDRQRIIPAMPLEQLLEQDHQARIVWEFCSGLDLTPLYQNIRSREGGPGRAALDPRLGVALWLYATLEGVGSARALDWLCSNHNAFRWLVGGVSVNYHTLADFRVEHPEFLDQLLTHSVAVLRAQGLVDLNRVAHDGMRVRASAGTASFHRKATLERHLQEAQEQITRLKHELTDDPNRIGRRKGRARERAARERAARLQQALEQLPELEARKKPAEKDQARASSTDPQARVMKMADGGFRPAYNLQFTVDCPSQAIVAVEASTSGSDMGQLKPAIEQMHSRLGVYPQEALADGGFAKHQDIEEIERDCGGCRVYVPVPEPRVPGTDPYAPGPNDSDVIIRWRARMGSVEGKVIYKDRASTVECVNAHNSNRGLVRLRVRGQSKVRSIALWFAVAQNVACGARLRAEAAVAA